MVHKNLCPSVEELHHRFSCDYSTGTLYWKNPGSPVVKVGSKVYVQPGRYHKIVLEVNGKRSKFLVHRIVWKMYYREDLDQKELDHTDMNRHNNAISNLRVATRSQNMHNRSHSKGFKRLTNDPYNPPNRTTCNP